MSGYLSNMLEGISVVCFAPLASLQPRPGAVILSRPTPVLIPIYVKEMAATSTSKGKQVEQMPTTPLPHPASGSADPAATLPSLWAFLLPALDHILNSPTDNINKAPTIDMEFYARVHSFCYNYITNRECGDPSGMELYLQLDKYFANHAQCLALGIPQDDQSLLQFLIPTFFRFSAGIQFINRLLNYVNRHYIKRAADEDKGWLTLDGVLKLVTKEDLSRDHSSTKIATLIREKKLQVLTKWGYKDGDSPEILAQAEASAEAASPLDRIVPISSLAYRRFRLSLVEPLLHATKLSGKPPKRRVPSNKPAPLLPRGRLARAVRLMLETQALSSAEKYTQSRELVDLLVRVGIRRDHDLIKVLNKHLTASSTTP
jgi:hypothetical protein